jgi:nicotinic acid phosphoribosyltransferase
MSYELKMQGVGRRVNTFLGPNEVGTKHIEELWDLQYLPIRIKALPEGTLCPIKVPALTFINTHPDFFWLTNYFETLISTTLWLPMTSATSARLAKKELVRHAKKTGFSEEVNLNFLIHDFSMRGMAGVEAAIMSGMGHMTSFCGSETIPAIAALEEYYNADAEKELIAATIPATEHSVMCAGGTFVGIANKIREVNPDRKLAIYVTHMVNPKGITTLSENYDEVYFTNSYKDWDKSDLPDNVRIIKVI